VYITRVGALPLPYLRSPAIDFVVYVPPLTYLTLLRQSPATPASTAASLPKLDVPIASLRKALADDAPAVLATLALARPHAPAAHFVQPVDPSHVPLPAAAGTDLPATPAWELTFAPPVLLSQARMRALHAALGLAPGLPGAGSTLLAPSWLDMLVRAPFVPHTHLY
jgi:hypothetical protein